VSRRQKRSAGFSYLEVLVATALLALALVPALEALEGAVRGAGIAETETRRHHRLVARLESVLAESLIALEIEAIATAGAPSDWLSDPPGTAGRRIVTLTPFDADGDSTPDPGIVRVDVRVEATEHAISSLAGP